MGSCWRKIGHRGHSLFWFLLTSLHPLCSHLHEVKRFLPQGSCNPTVLSNCIRALSFVNLQAKGPPHLHCSFRCLATGTRILGPMFVLLLNSCWQIVLSTAENIHILSDYAENPQLTSATVKLATWSWRSLDCFVAGL